MSPRKQRSSRTSPRRALLYFIVLSIPAAALGAAVLGWMYINKPRDTFFPNPPNTTIRFTFEHNGKNFKVEQRTNRWGLLGDQPPDDWDGYRTIVAVGGSTTQGLVLGYGRDFPHQLQTELRKTNQKTWVANAGVSGHSTRGHLRCMEEFVLRVSPDVVLFLVGANDLVLSLQSDRKKAKNQYPDRDFTYWRLLLRSRVVAFWHELKWLLRKKPPGELVRASSSFNFRPEQLSRKSALTLPPDVKDLLPLLGEYRGNLKRLIEVSRGNGIRPVFLTQPMFYSDTPYWRKIFGHNCAVAGSKGAISAGLYARLLGKYNKALLEVCAEEGVDCLDLRALIPREKRFFFDDIHFTEEGAALVAKKISEFLSQLPLEP